jgi:hypothetical protein
MKKVLCSLVVLCAAMMVQAQTMRVGNKFWDGYSLYTVKEIRMGTIVYMTTKHDDELTLEKVDGKEGEYTIIPSRQAEECPFGAEFGWRVQHITQDGENFLAVRKPNGDVMWTLSRTNQNEDECKEWQMMMSQEEPWNAVNGQLLNRAYLSANVATKEELRLLRNKILAYHGYRFQSEDLQEYFGKIAWYKPVDDNSTIKLDIVEQTNLQLIKSEEAARR